MKMRSIQLVSILMVFSSAVGCSERWQIDYGNPVAQFLETSVAAKGTAYIGKKITVKGMVTKVETRDPESSWIHLNEGVRCNLGQLSAMALNSKVGDTVYVDGFLKHCEKGDVWIEPAILRDPTATFRPEP